MRASKTKKADDPYKMSSRIPLSWLVVLALLSVIAFFGYHIGVAASNEPAKEKFYSDAQHSPEPAETPSLTPTSLQRPPKVPRYLLEKPEAHEEEQNYGEASARPSPAPKPVPNVPAQTEEELRMPEPLQQTPPTTHYDSPEATDPMNRQIHMGAEFGSNLRHPEQMIERRPAAGMAGVIPSGLGSETSNNGGNRPQMYTPEMAQNGGEFMSGIFAYDTSENGIGYSLV